MKIALIGSGSFGSTMGIVLAVNAIKNNSKFPIFMYIRRQELLESLISQRIHPDYPLFSDVLFPTNITFSDSLEEVLNDATHCVFAIPSKYSFIMLNEMKNYFNKNCKIISLVKGFYVDNENNFSRISSLIAKVLNLDYNNICSLGGPNVYSEIIKNYSGNNSIHRACNTVVSSVSEATAKEFQRLYFAENIIRTYYSNDIISSEISGALKNVIAIMSGISDGYQNKNGMGINFKSSLITRAAFEFSYFSRAFGGNPLSVYGLAGIGDLIATCLNGRSRIAGEYFSSGLTVEEIKQKMFPNEIEGFQTLQVINKYINTLRNSNPDVCLELPLVEGIYKLVFENDNIELAVNRIINRPMKKEIREDPYFLFA